MSLQKPEAYMGRAVALSRRGYPAPNPHVGCVLVKADIIVGEGWHDFYGGPHAEAVALGIAGAKAEGATAYVTLEPCNHSGMTGPCSKALLEAGVAEVVYACADPNPIASGGAQALRNAGIKVRGGLLASRAKLANLRFMRSFELGRPYVVLKAAISLDGRIALPSGESKWITGEKARREGQKLRAECGAVLVGRKTVEKDDPHLTARVRGVRNQPLRIVLDPNRSLPDDAKVFSDGGKTVRVVRPGLDGLEVPMADGHFDLVALLGKLSELNVNGLLVEGGAVTLNAFLSAGLADRLELFIAPIVLGQGPSWIDGDFIDTLAAAYRFKHVRSRMLGDDLQISLERAVGAASEAP